MLAKIFKKTSTPKRPGVSPAIARLNQFGTRSVICTIVTDAEGRNTNEEVGLVSFYSTPNRLFSRDGYLYLAPPAGYDYKTGPLRGRGEKVRLKFQYQRTPYSLDCEVMQRVRFSDRLLAAVEPRVEIGLKLKPTGSVVKNDHRRSLRFGHVRGVKGPVVAPNFRFDAYVERIAVDGSFESKPEVIPYPGDDPVPAAVKACDTSEEMVDLFHQMMRTNPEVLRSVHITKAERDARNGRTDLVSFGEAQVLGLDGATHSTHIKVRRPKHAEGISLKDGDVVVLHFLWRELAKSVDLHHSWVCRVFRTGLKVVTLRPKGIIEQQTGLPVVIRDFSVSGVSIQNSPLLETYLLDGENIATDPSTLCEQMVGKKLLMTFYPRLHYPGDLATYQPQVPPVIPLIGEIVRGQIDSGKDQGRVANLGIAFRYDPADYDSAVYSVSAWEPLRALRDNPHFKEIHRSLNGLLAYLKR